MKPVHYPATLMEAAAFFADEAQALAFFAKLRWPEGVECPHCGSKNVLFLRNQGRWKCTTKHPRQQFSAKVGTIFEDSPLSLGKWMVAVWLEANCKNSISSYEVARALGITQKSAWFMQQRVRLAMQSGSFKKMTGGVEADETFIGGKARNMHADKRKRVIKARGMSGKAAVMGLLDRHSKEVRTVVVDNVKRRTLHPIIRQHVEPGTPVYTDAHPAYVGLSPEYIHKVIDHAECYVKEEVHTNGLENFWSLFKRCIKGTHVSVAPFHLFRYLDAECFRFNNRKANDGLRFLMAMAQVDGRRLTYKDLTGKLQDNETEQSRRSDGNIGAGDLPN